jgi:hypothetical protein
MGGEDAYPAEMPDRPRDPIPALDPDTAERLLSGRLDPDDAPPGYAEVAAVLQAAAGPAHPRELAGQAAALAMFGSSRAGPAGARGGRPPSRRGRARLVALALAGTLVTGGAAAAGGLWTGADVQPSGRLRSPTGGPGGGGSGSAASDGVGGTWRMGSGADRALGPATPGGSGSAGSLTSAGKTTGSGSGGRGASRGDEPVRPEKPSKPNSGKAEKVKPVKVKPVKAKPVKAKR